MKNLKVLINKAGKGISAHLPELEGFVIARSSVAQLKKDIQESICFHIEGLYPEERQAWMGSEYEFEYVGVLFGPFPIAWNAFYHQKESH